MSLPGWEDVERRHIVLTGLRAISTSLLVLVVYFVVPISSDPHGSILLRLTVGLVFFVIALTYEVRAVLRSGRPILRAADALALVIPIFMVVFAWTYLTLARSDPGAFSQPLNRVSALYFTVTVFSTVGFGDITPLTDPARVAVMAQMLCDLIFIAVVVRLILEAARGSLGARTTDVRSDSTS
jgi:Ion channel